MRLLSLLLGCALTLPAAAGFVRVSWTATPGATSLRSGCVAQGQYERPPVALVTAAGTITLEGLPDTGRCYFALNSGPQDEWFYDFALLNGGPALPGAVGSLAITWSPTPPAPPPAAVTVTVASYDASTGEFDLTITGTAAVTMQALAGAIDWCKPGGELGNFSTPTTPSLGVQNNDGVTAATVVLQAPVAKTRCDIDPNAAFPGLKFTVSGVAKTMAQPGVLSW